MQTNHPTSPSRRAYTLIEVLIVVAILGVVSAVVVPHMLTAGSLGVQAAARVVVADILYAQNDAIAAQAGRKIVFTPADDKYELQDAGGAILTAQWINGEANNYVVDFSDDTRFQGVEIKSASFAGGGTTLEFDDLGGPVNGGTVVIEYNDQEYRITVAPFTGRVTVAKL